MAELVYHWRMIAIKAALEPKEAETQESKREGWGRYFPLRGRRCLCVWSGRQTFRNQRETDTPVSQRQLDTPVPERVENPSDSEESYKGNNWVFCICVWKTNQEAWEVEGPGGEERPFKEKGGVVVLRKSGWATIAEESLEEVPCEWDYVYKEDPWWGPVLSSQRRCF